MTVTFADLESGRVKPEFGNWEHINAIKEHQIKQELLETQCECCSGEGEIECEHCDGNGYVSCDDCDGTGQIE